MSSTSALKIDKLQTVGGSQVMTLGTGGSIAFDGSFNPSNFGIPFWNGSGQRPTSGLSIGSFGWNSKNLRFEVYVGIDSQTGDALWAVFDGKELDEDELEP